MDDQDDNKDNNYGLVGQLQSSEGSVHLNGSQKKKQKILEVTHQ